jgi:hypothetical protein
LRFHGSIELNLIADTHSGISMTVTSGVGIARHCSKLGPGLAHEIQLAIGREISPALWAPGPADHAGEVLEMRHGTIVQGMSPG